MKILLIGTGALGCFYGAKIARFGGDVTFFSRGKSYQLIKEKGIEIKSSLEESFLSQVQIINALPNNPQFDLVIIATKSYDVKPLVDKLPDSLLSSSYFMTLQNGVVSEEILLQKIDSSRLLPASAFIGVCKLEPNTVHHTGGGRFQFGVFPGGERKGFLDELSQLLEQSQIDLHFSENIMRVKWEKLVWNTAFSSLSTVTQLTLGDILSSHYGTELLRDLLGETVSIARKIGYELSDAFIDKQMSLPKNLYSFKISMLQDFISGKPLEIDAILEDVIKKGKLNDIPTPTISHIYTILKIMLNARDNSVQE